MSDNATYSPKRAGQKVVPTRASWLLEQAWAFRLIGLVLLIVPAGTLVMIVKLYHNVPWGDQISLFFGNRFQQGLSPSTLFVFNNEHEIFFTKLLIYWDYIFLHGSNFLPYAASTVTILAVCGFYCWILKEFGNLSSPLQLLVSCGILTALYFNGRMLWTITCPILFEHPSTALLAVLACFAFSRLPFALAGEFNSDPRPRLSPAALIATFVLIYVLAAMSSATGVLIGPALVIVACGLLIGPRLFPMGVVVKALLAASVATVVIAGAYAGAYRASTAGSLRPAALHPLAGLRFMALFVGAAFFRDSDWPVTRHSNTFVMYSVAALFWLLLVWLAVQLFRRRAHLTSFEIFHACVIVFVVLAGAVGGLFRSDLSSFEGINKKYAPVALLAWLSAASLFIYIHPKTFFGGRRRPWVRPLAICTTMVLLLMPGNLSEFHVWQDWERQVKETASAAASGVYSELLLRRFYADDEEAYQVVQGFIRDRAYCYRQMPQPGYRLQDRFRVTDAKPEPLQAVIARLDQRPGMDGFTASGTSAIMRAAAFPSLVITDSKTRVIGYGNVSSIAPGGHPTGAAKPWFAAFRLTDQAAVGPLRVYRLNGVSASLAGEIPKPVPQPAMTVANPSAVALPRVPDHTDYVLEVFNGVSSPIIQPPIRLSAAQEISLLGWAVDRDGGTGVAALEVLIDRKPYPCQTGLDRPDIATYFRQPQFGNAGFSFKLPAIQVGAGRHELRLRIYTNGGKSYLESRVFPFIVE